MTPELLATAIRDALAQLCASGVITVAADAIPSEITVERPKNPDHGDWATNIALVIAKAAGQPPRQCAQALADHLSTNPAFDRIDVAGPGFINLTIAAGAAAELVHTIVRAGAHYGTSQTLEGQTINVEFISANPTGPLHLGHTRWAVVGDAISRVLRAAGATVVKEFYINDRGSQLDKFGASITARAVGREVPEDGYQGDYIAELAADIVAHHPEFLDLPEQEQMIAFREAGYARQLGLQRETLERFRTNFDVWYSERSLHESGAVDRGMSVLREHGHMFEADGAVWLRTTDFDDDKDRVLIKADGSLTYFASDTAYYVDKRVRGFDICIYLLGADHHGYVNRLRAVAACAGDDPDANIEVLIGQMVKMMREGKEVRLSKRTGDMITLDDLADDVGVDAARYSLVRYPADSPLTLDLDLLVKQSNDNPVYYVQYAHARISSVLRTAAELGFVPTLTADWDASLVDFSRLEHEREADLIAALGEYSRTVAFAAQVREPHRVARYLEDLGAHYHRFYDACRVLPRGEEEFGDVSLARLWLCAATRQVLANGLELMGVQAPERM
ncbi:MAG: arginine--tRNA ligase [Actinobacteria bacterium]|nr:arginine--tRNA ligase [Actinomycetota bacterium]